MKSAGNLKLSEFSKGKCLLAYGIAHDSNQQSSTSGILFNLLHVLG
ncbi:MAG: hypothetical protein Q8S84_04530 [bacterium]|nr:hypothetical protein [bacterium]